MLATNKIKSQYSDVGFESDFHGWNRSWAKGFCTSSCPLRLKERIRPVT